MNLGHVAFTKDSAAKLQDETSSLVVTHGDSVFLFVEKKT